VAGTSICWDLKARQIRKRILTPATNVVDKKAAGTVQVSPAVVGHSATAAISSRFPKMGNFRKNVLMARPQVHIPRKQ
jgi:hypothetical protein